MMYSLLTKWNQDVTFVNGRPRHSQSQGLIERGNREVEKKIAAMKNERGFVIFNWSSVTNKWINEQLWHTNIVTFCQNELWQTNAAINLSVI